MQKIHADEVKPNDILHDEEGPETFIVHESELGKFSFVHMEVSVVLSDGTTFRTNRRFLTTQQFHKLND